MAKSKKKKSSSKKKLIKSKKKQVAAKSIDYDADRSGKIWEEALELEKSLEEKLLEDAILSAKLALQELEEETRKAPFERRSGLRLKEKAEKTERAFNRIRALRKGEQLPERHPDEY